MKYNNKSHDDKGEKNDHYIQLANFISGSDESFKQHFLLNDTEKFVINKLKGVTKTQMRNIFELFKNCKTTDDLKMTKPKLIYTAGRISGEGKNFLIELSKSVMNVNEDSKMENFKKYIETVLAYHKYYAIK